jgi:hypothetical protein
METTEKLAQHLALYLTTKNPEPNVVLGF